MKKVFALAAIAAASFISQAFAQVPTLVNGNLETPDSLNTAPLGWRLLNFGVYREIGDGLTPATITHSGTRSAVMPGASGIPGGELQNVMSEEYVNAQFQRNWPQFVYNPPNGSALVVSFWFNIAASDPMVGSRLGAKLQIKRQNTSNYQEWEQLWVDPDNDAVYPGCFKVSTPGGNGIHTNGQWVKYEAIFNQSQIEFHLVPPTNPAAVSVWAMRFGSTESTGAVWIDDISFRQQCPADFNKDGIVSIDDLFLYLNAYFVGCP